MLYLQNSAGIKAKNLLEDAFEFDFEVKKRAWEMWNKQLLKKMSELDLQLPEYKGLFIGRHHGGFALAAAASGLDLDVLLLEDESSEDLRFLLEKHALSDRVQFIHLEEFHQIQHKYPLLFLQNALSCAGAGALRMHTKLSLGNIYQSVEEGAAIFFFEELKGAWIHQHWTTRGKTRIPIEEMATLDDFQELVDASSHCEIKTAGFFSAFFTPKSTSSMGKMLKKMEHFDHLDFVLPKRWKHAAFGWMTK